jgi:folate-binding Fe-S cluster repair protein YgfZ
MTALFELEGRGRIRATGEDRKRLLHAMTTNHVEQLAPGQGCYAFFLNANGRILSDVHVLAAEESLLLDVEPASREFVLGTWTSSSSPTMSP